MPIIDIETATLIPADFPHSVRTTIRIISDVEHAEENVQIALVESSKILRLLPVLAARSGALVSIIKTWADIPVPLWRLVAERALCVNTTAAGGNASLMTLDG